MLEKDDVAVVVMGYKEFIESERLDKNDASRKSTSVTMNKNRLKYFKYIAYKTDRNLSDIIESMLYSDFDEFTDMNPLTMACADTFAKTHNF